MSNRKECYEQHCQLPPPVVIINPSLDVDVENILERTKQIKQLIIETMGIPSEFLMTPQQRLAQFLARWCNENLTNLHKVNNERTTAQIPKSH